MACAAESKTSEILTPEKWAIFNFSDEGWKPEDCTDEKVQALAVQFFKVLCEDARIRTQLAQNDSSILDRHFWYPGDYLRFLQRHGQIEKYEHLRAAGHFYRGLPPKNFETAQRRQESPYYQLKVDALPSDALDEMLPPKNSQFYFIDCGMLVQLAYYCALREIFGKVRFNYYFHIVLNPKPSPTLTRFCDIRQDLGPPKFGDNCYFSNVGYYLEKHPYGESRGLHVICVSEGEDPKYEGFGLQKPDSSAQDVFSFLAAEYNKAPTPAEQVLPKEQVTTPPLPRIERPLNPEELQRMAVQFPGRVGLAPQKMRLSAQKIRTFLEKYS